MKIGIAADHRGIELKQKLIKFLKNSGYNIIDYGTNNSDSVDYPDYAFKIGEEVANKKIDLGILICRTGIGMSIACNKVKGIRCGKVNNVEEVMLARNDNNINVLAISYTLDFEAAKEIVLKFLETPFSTDERHIRRVNKIDNYGKTHEC